MFLVEIFVYRLYLVTLCVHNKSYSVHWKILMTTSKVWPFNSCIISAFASSTWFRCFSAFLHVWSVIISFYASEGVFSIWSIERVISKTLRSFNIWLAQSLVFLILSWCSKKVFGKDSLSWFEMWCRYTKRLLCIWNLIGIDHVRK